MLLYSRKAPPKAPKRRSRAGCIHCKEKKKKCNEQRPQCDRCTERNLKCEYEPVKPRKRRRTSMALSQVDKNTPRWNHTDWTTQYHDFKQEGPYFGEENADQWDAASAYTYPVSEAYFDYPGQDQVTNVDEDDVEEIIRTNSISDAGTPGGMGVASRSQVMDLATIAPSPVASPLFEFSAPVFQEFSDQRNRRALVDHFCNCLSHLIVFKEDTGNPFRQLVLPLSHASSPVMNAIYALSSAHLEYRGIENEEKSLDFHNKALQGLAGLLDGNSMANREEVLGAIMLLVYYEVLVQKGNSNIIHGHLKGALTIMESQHTAPTPTTLFLERAFRFYDVISALSWGTAPISNIPPAFSPFSPSTPTFDIPSFGDTSAFSTVDTLLGMATDLWPIIHRLSNLLSIRADLAEAELEGNTSKATVLRTELESTTQAIEQALTNWTPSFPTPTKTTARSASISTTTITDLDDPLNSSNELTDPSPDDSDNRLQSILNNAEAYRQAALVYLYRYIKKCGRHSEKVQRHTRLALGACIRVVEWAGPMSALLWPLFIASVEAVDEGDRMMARSAFGGTEQRQGMTNIARAWEVVEEVWRNEDLGIEVCWRDICREKGFNIVFG